MGQTSTIVRDCQDLRAPRIRVPFPGEDFALVTSSVPGARIRVYDADGDEIGDGSEPVVILEGALESGDVVSVVQQLGNCTSRDQWTIEVKVF